MGTVEMRTTNRIALLIALAGAVVWGIAIGLPGNQIPMSMTGGLFVGAGGTWVWMGLK